MSSVMKDPHWDVEAGMSVIGEPCVSMANLFCPPTGEDPTLDPVVVSPSLTNFVFYRYAMAPQCSPVEVHLTFAHRKQTCPLLH